MRTPRWLRRCYCQWTHGGLRLPHATCPRHNKLVTTTPDRLLREAEKVLRRNSQLTETM